MKHKYFVSYSGTNKKDGDLVNGMCELTLDRRMVSFEDIVHVKRTIERDNEFENIIIHNWKKLKK